MSGSSFKRNCRGRRLRAVVFVTGYGDVPMAVGAMKAGAIDFLTKPFRSQALLDAVFAALERDNARRQMQQWHTTICGNILSPSVPVSEE